MTEFYHFKDLYLNLNSEEKIYLSRLIKLKNDEDTFGNKVIEEISNSNEVEFEFVFKKVYKSKSVDGFRKILERLNDKIYDVLINRDNILNNKNYDQRAKNIFQLLRRTLVSDILTYRGLSRHSDKLIERVIDEAKFYEHFDILVYALGKKLNKNFKHSSVVEKLEGEIMYYQESSLKLNQVINIYYTYLGIDSILKKSVAEQNITSDLKKAIEISMNSNSTLVKMHVFYLQFHYLLLHNQNRIGLMKSEELIDFIFDNKGLNSVLRLVNAYLNKGLFLRLEFSFALSIGTIEDAKKIISDSPDNHYVIYEQLFLTYFFWCNLSKAQYYFKALLNYQSVFRDEYKLGYYKQCLNLVFNTTFALRPLEYYNDSDGNFINVNIRLLNIIVLVNSEKYDLSDSNIDNFRKYLSKKNIKNILPTRLRIILKLVTFLARNSYNFEVIVYKYERLFYQLTEPESSWQPNSYELIVFEEWFLAKAKGEMYNHKEVMAKMKKRYTERKNSISLLTV